MLPAHQHCGKLMYLLPRNRDFHIAASHFCLTQRHCLELPTSFRHATAGRRSQILVVKGITPAADHRVRLLQDPELAHFTRQAELF